MKRKSLKRAFAEHQQQKSRALRSGGGFVSRQRRLADLSVAELHARREAIVNDSANWNTGGGIYLYKPAARRKLDDIAWAIRNRMGEAK